MTTAGRPSICVVGDLLADTDVCGVVDRLSPEAPVPVVDERTVVHRPGGAGLAATMSARAGADVTLVSAVADDEAGARLRRLLGDEGIELCALTWQGTTVEKIRIRAGEHPMLRLDRGAGSVGPLPADLTGAVVDAIGAAHAILVADYGRGVARNPDVRAAIARARRRGVPVVWDPHRNGEMPVPHTTLVCPNEDEALSFEPDVERDARLAVAIGCARRLRRRWSVGAVAVTLGDEGAVVVLGDGAPFAVPVPAPTAAADTCGAGDAFASAAALAMAGGAVVSEAVQVAVDGAARFVADGGAAGMASTPAVVPPEVGTAAVPAPTDGSPARTLVATGGCFDILHPGHVHTLRAARRLGDRLVVLLNDDASVRRLKGPDRPLQSVADRRAVLESLADVDEVIVFGEDTPVEALRRLRPDVFVKGGDYTAADLPETDVLAEWSGSVVTVPFLDGRSTTELVSRARAGTRR
jgi:D-beta-D-heptose 7-phosphate kinase/D-beta-D-heptose 1-phosphate adenosyltransferase